MMLESSTGELLSRPAFHKGSIVEIILSKLRLCYKTIAFHFSQLTTWFLHRSGLIIMKHVTIEKGWEPLSTQGNPLTFGQATQCLVNRQLCFSYELPLNEAL